ncbi:MAG: hypothetical protein Q9M91_04075 [Candidatus Dojkabacteria bacterium]|nr:hypothetical protein [Candidatus Dojkabacteria bacterium]
MNDLKKWKDIAGDDDLLIEIPDNIIKAKIQSCYLNPAITLLQNLIT